MHSSRAVCLWASSGSSENVAGQYDVYRLGDGTLVLILQSDLLDGLRTRVVAPLIPAEAVGRVMETLNPQVQVGEGTYILMPQLAATLSLSELGERQGSLGVLHERIVRAVDALLSGI